MGTTIFNIAPSSKFQVHEPLGVKIIGVLSVVMFFTVYLVVHCTGVFNRSTLNSAYNEKKYAENLLCYRQLFIKGHILFSEWGIFGVEIFLHYS